MAKDSVLLLGVLVFVLAVLGFFSCGSKVIPASRIITKESLGGKPPTDLCEKKNNDEEKLQRSMYRSHLKYD
tara:strand:+ start:1948 stop:2163 length:216 start_codon:yes stop_codon:yes gene_type:complete